jgi:hypothetical protein
LGTVAAAAPPPSLQPSSSNSSNSSSSLLVRQPTPAGLAVAPERLHPIACITGTVPPSVPHPITCPADTPACSPPPPTHPPPRISPTSGQGSMRDGADGGDLIIKVPVGTIIRKKEAEVRRSSSRCGSNSRTNSRACRFAVACIFCSSCCRSKGGSQVQCKTAALTAAPAVLHTRAAAAGIDHYKEVGHVGACSQPPAGQHRADNGAWNQLACSNHTCAALPSVS